MAHYTTIKQSQHLIELGLPTKSADMSWVSCDDGNQTYYQAENRKIVLNYERKHWLPCWSLGALLEVMPKIPRVEFNLVLPGVSDEPPYIAFDDCRENYQVHLNFEGETTLEAAYNTVCWLLENGYIKKEA